MRHICKKTTPELNFNIITTFQLLIILQGLLFGFLLLYKSKVRKASYLGAFILILSLSMVHYFLLDTGLGEVYEDAHFLPTALNLLIYSFLYLYVSDLTSKNKKIHWWVFYPAILDLVIQIIVFFMPNSTIKDEIWHVQVFIRGFFNLVWSFFIVFKMIYMLYKRKKVIHENEEYKAIKWALYLLYTMLSFEFLALLHFVFGFSLGFGYREDIKTFMVFYGSIFVYWVTLKVFFHEKTIALFPTLEIKDRTQVKTTSQVVKDDEIEVINEEVDNLTEFEEIVGEAEQLISSKALFKKPDLTILDISRGLDLHHRKLSKAINLIKGENFNTYINRFRVAEAKEMLINSKYKHWSVEGIGQEVGFKSKSSFYGAFKKFENTTPLRFKQQVTALNDNI